MLRRCRRIQTLETRHQLDPQEWHNTLLSALKACSSLKDMEAGRKIHSDLHTVTNFYVANSLVTMYAKCNSLSDARSVFERMPQHNTASWNAFLLGCSQNQRGDLALQQFERMQESGCEPDNRTFVAAVLACADLASKEDPVEVNTRLIKPDTLQKGRSIHSLAEHANLCSDVFLSSSLIHMYSKCGSMADAEQVFDSGTDDNVFSWTSLILGYVENGESEKALKTFSRMHLFGCQPDARTLVGAFMACAALAEKEPGTKVDGKVVKTNSLSRGKAIYSQVSSLASEFDLFIGGALIDMYSKCRSMSDARRVFENMPFHNVVSWTALILGYVDNGEPDSALECYYLMKSEGYVQNARTFIAALGACGDSAKLNEGKEIHRHVCMQGIESDTFLANALLDFYGRCGSLDDSQRVFESVDKPDVVAWSSLISAYSRQGDSERVLSLFQRMKEGGVRGNSITLLAVLTACSHGGLVDKGRQFFQEMVLKYGEKPSIEHYHCMIDMLGRAGYVEEAVAMVRSMPLEANVVTWKTVLAACKKWKNVKLGEVAFQALLNLDVKQDGPYRLMAGIYSS